MNNFKNRIFKNGKSLNPELYCLDIPNRTFSSNESFLVLNFENINYFNFQIASNCIIITGYHCTFNAGNHCKFITRDYCEFIASYNCTFNIGIDCTFINVMKNCVIIASGFSGKIGTYKPLPRQKFIIDTDLNLHYDNPIVDIKYKK